MMENETTILECRMTLLAFIPHIFFALLFFAAALSGGDGAASRLVVAALIVLYIAIRYKTTYIKLTDKRLIGHVGFIKSKRLATYIAQVGDIATENGLLGKIFKYHTVTVTTVGSSTYKFKGMKNGVAFADAVHAHMAQQYQSN